MTTKDEMIEILVKLQSLQRIAMGIVTLEIASRIYDDETCNIDVMVSVPASRGIEDRFKFFNFYCHNEEKDNKKVMSALIDQLKEWGAL